MNRSPILDLSDRDCAGDQLVPRQDADLRVNFSGCPDCLDSGGKEITVVSIVTWAISFFQLEKWYA